MKTLTVPGVSTATAPRITLLDGYLHQLRDRYATLDPHPIVELTEGAVEVTAWVAARISAFAGTTEAEGTDLDRSVAQAVALQIKCKVDLIACRGLEPCPELFQAQAELMLDVAVGTALGRQLQTLSDELLADGHMGDARALSTLRHDLRNAVVRAKKGIGESEQARALEIAQELVPATGEEAFDVPSSPSDSRTDSGFGAPSESAPGGPEQSGGKTRPAHRAQRTIVLRDGERVPDGPRSIMLWAAIGLVAFGALGALDAVRRAATQQADAAAAPLTFADTAPLLEIEGITHVQDRPPHLVLTVDGTFWNELGTAGRERWLESRVEEIDPMGYEGIVIRDPVGIPRAEWVRGKGQRLLR